MKGIIFTSFLNFLEAELGLVASERIIAQAKLNSGGAYTTVGFYDYKELLQLISISSPALNATPSQISQKFGGYLFRILATASPQHIRGKSSCMELFETINDVIHAEIKSLYPEANPPQIRYDRISPTTATLYYQSHRCLGDVMLGLIEGASKYFCERLQIQRKKSNKAGNQEVFTITILEKIENKQKHF
jgi:hypothetical protein